jgi:hypothetical protein
MTTDRSTLAAAINASGLWAGHTSITRMNVQGACGVTMSGLEVLREVSKRAFEQF